MYTYNNKINESIYQKKNTDKCSKLISHNQNISKYDYQISYNQQVDENDKLLEKYSTQNEKDCVQFLKSTNTSYGYFKENYNNIKFDLIAISNRHLCKSNFIEKIYELSRSESIDYIILREKNLCEDEYYKLANNILNICHENSHKIILHTFVNVAKKLNHKHIHITMNDLKKYVNQNNSNNTDILKKDFNTIGVSTHSVEEAILAQNLGATYITTSHIFKTDCKKDLEPKGLKLVKDTRSAVDTPIYGLGGINNNNYKDVLNHGADGICMMSYFMK